jgi:hypothetical protein
MRHYGRFTNVGKLKKIRRGNKEIIVFIPNKVGEISSNEFYNGIRTKTDLKSHMMSRKTSISQGEGCKDY